MQSKLLRQLLTMWRTGVKSVRGKAWDQITGVPFDNSGVRTRQVKFRMALMDAMKSLEQNEAIWVAPHNTRNGSTHGAWAHGVTRRRARAVARQMARRDMRQAKHEPAAI